MADLGLTSIDRLELVNFLEQEYRLDIEDSQIGPQTRVSDLRQIIAKREKLTRRDHFRFWTNSALVQRAAHGLAMRSSTTPCSGFSLRSRSAGLNGWRSWGGRSFSWRTT